MMKQFLILGILMIGLCSYGQSQNQSAITLQKQSSIEKQNARISTSAITNEVKQDQVEAISIKPTKTVNLNKTITYFKKDNKSPVVRPIQKLTLTPTKQYQEVKMTFKKMNDRP